MFAESGGGTMEEVRGFGAPGEDGTFPEGGVESWGAGAHAAAARLRCWCPIPGGQRFSLACVREEKSVGRCY